MEDDVLKGKGAGLAVMNNLPSKVECNPTKVKMGAFQT